MKIKNHSMSIEAGCSSSYSSSEFFHTVFYPDNRTILGVYGVDHLRIVLTHESYEDLVHAKHHKHIYFICGEKTVTFSHHEIGA